MAAEADDAYIANENGDQYFNTGHFVGPNTRIEMDCQLLDLTLQVRPFGVAGAADATHPYCLVYLGQKTTGGTPYWSWQASRANFSAQSNNAYEADLARHTIVLDMPNARFQVLTDGSVEYTENFVNTVGSGTQTIPLGIFARCDHKSGAYSTATMDPTYSNPAKMRLYSFRIYESGTLVKEFLPYVKGGVAGLKETKSGVFHTGENARSCVAGGDVPVEKDDPYVFFPDNDVTTKTAVSGVSRYFETGYSFKSNSRIEIDYALLTPDWTSSLKWAGETYLFYAKSATQQLDFMPYGSSANGRHYVEVGGLGGGVTEVGVNYGYNVRRTVSASANNIKMTTAGYTNFNINVASGKVISNTLDTVKLTIGYRDGKTPIPCKVYSLKIYETENGTETLVHDFEPSVSNSVQIFRDVCGTLANNLPTVYGAASARNVIFDVGGDVQGDENAGEAYLDFDKTRGHGIDTGYVITKDSRIELDFAIWNKEDSSEQQYLFEQRGYDAVAAKCNGIWFRLYSADSGRIYGYRFYDYESGNDLHWSSAPFGNGRIKFVFDGPGNRANADIEGRTVWSTDNLHRTGNTISDVSCTETLHIGSNWNNVSNPTGMRLYSVKIYKAGVLDRCYVPCVKNGTAGLYELVENEFFAAAGGKVAGATLAGQEFQIAPEATRLSASASEKTLKCLAAGAQSYEWYVDGEKIEGETSDTLTVRWSDNAPGSYVYSVVPVYTVFNETVRGAAASADVELTPLGLKIIVR